MTRRSRTRKNKQANAGSGAPPPPPAPAPLVTARAASAGQRRYVRPVLIGIGLLGIGALVVGLANGFDFGGSSQDSADDPSDKKVVKDTTGASGDSTEKKTDGGFLDSFRGKKAVLDGDARTAAANDEMEKDFAELVKNADRQKEIKAAGRRAQLLPGDEVAELLGEQKRLVERYNTLSAALETKLQRARQDRPDDGVPHWLTGELHKLVGGVPDKVLPHLQKAVDAGVDRARLFASLAFVQIDNNQLARAFESASKALDRDSQDRYVWNAFTLAALHYERFANLVERLDETFPDRSPPWAAEIKSEAKRLQARWEVELKQRSLDEKADLPRVRFLVRHRHFVLGADGKQTKIENTGDGEVVVELFEDQAPLTVGNFISLVEKGFYDGTRFHRAMAAVLVVGGDPNSKDDDPQHDGEGGPGYIIPDEFNAAGARSHFRGVLTMYNKRAPHTAGSQFLFALSPQPGMDGNFTAFGRVIKGQNVIDAITIGSTYPKRDERERIIPGDLLVSAKVLRKRKHAYKVTKLEE